VKLKKLELYGFKSFADKTVFDFEDSISALVGPNGSGKSNVVDAIKWVLGERSAQKLRGTEMTSVIFNGSDSRKPLNYAEAKLVIDNADHWLPVDYEEVSIARRVDRTGQSGFFLNGKPCRLKDVRNLLLDTGMGTSSYSFIEQGQIDRILRSSPKERRQIFEEAAGINRFLDQKREAERKLEKVGQNLARVSDIVEEVERQLRSVKYQAGRARTFKQQSERLLRLRLAHGLHTYRDLSGQRERCADEISRTATAKTELDGLHATAEADLESARAQLQTAQDELAQVRQRLTRVEGRLDGLAREAELNRTRGEELQHQLDAAEQRRRAAEERAQALNSEIDATAQKLELILAELTQKSERFDETRRRIDSLRSETRGATQALEAGKSKVFDLFQRESQLNNQTEILATEKRTLLHRMERIDSRTQELAAQERRIEEERAQAQEQLSVLTAEQGELMAQIEELRQTLADARRRAEDIAAQEASANGKLSGTQARLEALEDLEARAEGVHSGAKKLLQAELPGTVGLVAAALQVPAQIAGAVEALLGDRAQAVIFERMADAHQALSELAADGSGRADLIVLECIAAPERVQLPSQQGLRGRLCDLITCDEAVAPVAELLLGNAFLAEDSAAAESLLDAGLPAGARLVTPDGTCYGGDGVWTGGAAQTPGLISRRSELAELRVRAEECRRRLAELAEMKNAAWSQVRDHEGTQQTLTARSEDLKQALAEARGRLQVAARRADEVRDELRMVGAEKKSIRTDVEEIEVRKKHVAEQIADVQRERADTQQAVQQQQEALQTMQEEEHALADRVNELSGELATTREQHRNVRALLDRLQTDRRNREAELATLIEDQKLNARRQADAERAARAAQSEKLSLSEQRDSLQAALEESSVRVQRLQQDIIELAERTRTTTSHREELDQELHRLRLAENETSIKIQDLLERVADDCGVSLRCLQQKPESWREQPPFTRKLIREFCEEAEDGPAPEPVAAWYREVQQGPAPEQPEQEDEPELIDLAEAVRLRDDVMALVDDAATEWDKVKAEVASLKAKVDRIGNVNVDAIREQEELESRLKFLTEQKEDLEKARRHEREIIRELSKKSRERFAETFEQIRQNFQALFRKLFGGGSADLVLDEEEDILEAGIDLIARPPGKHTTSITLLSGGERALTTAALLLAMFQAKPSPFCLLDEVDAPLDDSNVERFLSLLAEFAKDTQFVVITHNKQTMAMAEVLYGLTMTDGISQKISVRFEDVERRLKLTPAPRAKAG